MVGVEGSAAAAVRRAGRQSQSVALEPVPAAPTKQVTQVMEPR
jgi:hypothetical protein